MKVLITGAAGFIGSALCSRLSSDNKVVGVDITRSSSDNEKTNWEQADLTDEGSVTAICEKYSLDVVIHCAGIAHQKLGAVDSAAYMRVNSEVTENLAKAAAKCNPNLTFIFLSSVSVYGEMKKGDGRRETGDRKDRRQETGEEGEETGNRRREKGNRRREKGDRKDGGPEDGRQETGKGRTEDGECRPSSDYAVSKLDAERRLRVLYDEGKLRNLVILRLAPVYDREWSLNLDRRVFAPGKVAYLRFGTGMQRMSALARPNLVDFIAHLIGKNWPQTHTDSHRHTGRKKDKNTGLSILNVCDAEAYAFNRIIEVFRKSGIRPRRPVISVPLSFVWVVTRVGGCLLRNKREWVYSCYDKLACDLVFDNGRMMGTGFRVRHSLETIFDPQITQICAD